MGQAAKAEAAEAAERGTAIADDGVYFALLPFGPTGATFSQWHKVSQKAKATFDRSRERLVTAGRVKREGDRYYAIAWWPEMIPRLTVAMRRTRRGIRGSGSLLPGELVSVSVVSLGVCPVILRQRRKSHGLSLTPSLEE